MPTVRVPSRMAQLNGVVVRSLLMPSGLRATVTYANSGSAHFCIDGPTYGLCGSDSRSNSHRDGYGDRHRRASC